MKSQVKIILIILLLILSGCNFTDREIGASSDISIAALTAKYNASTEIKNKYQLLGSVLKTTPKDDPKDRIEIVVGNETKGLGAAGEFEPSVKISRWDGEVSIKLTPKGLDKVASKDKKLSFDKNKIKYETPKIDYVMYDLPVSEELAEGGYEYEIILKERPVSNVVEFELETQGLDYFYQPALVNENPDGSSWEEVDGDRAEQPVNVNGSYAVYTSEFKMNFQGQKEYKAGKVGHIYRPKIIDANGNWIWGDFNQDLQDTKKLTVTIPKEWLDKAVYPVVVDPTFGYTTAGGSYSTSPTTNYSFAKKGTPAYAGDVYIVNAYVYAAAGTTLYHKGIILDTNADLIANGTGAASDAAGSTASWKSSSYATAASVSASTVYYAGVVFSKPAGSGECRLYRDSGSAGDSIYESDNSYATPQSYAGESSSTYQYSIYAVYAPTAEGTYTDTYTNTGTHSWRCPAGVSSVDVACWGAGGTGSANTNEGGNGGGGGAYAASTGVAVTAGNSYTVVVGATIATYGGYAGDSSFNSTDVVADGGQTAYQAGRLAGVGGTVANSTGDTRYAGGAGGVWLTTNDTGGGGGGAAGPDGAGNNGADAAETTGGAGGSGDAGSGGTAGTAGNGGAGGNGGFSTSGGGGGGGGDTSSTGGIGGGYGGGGGGGEGAETATTHKGASGACTITYTIGAAAATEETRPQPIIWFD